MTWRVLAVMASLLLWSACNFNQAVEDCIASGRCYDDAGTAGGGGGVAGGGVAGGGATGGGTAGGGAVDAGQLAQLSAMPPSPLMFATTLLSNSAAMQTYTITNTGEQTSGAITEVHTGSTTDFAVVSTCDQASLTAGSTCSIQVTFTPTANGVRLLGVNLTANPGGTLNLSASGRGSDPQTLTVRRDGGTGSGRVISDDGGLDCGAVCTQQIERGDPVTLTEQTATGSSFSGWSGSCSGLGTTCMLTMNGPQAAVATFALDSYPLTVVRTSVSTANGSVVSTPAGINCPGTCTASFPYGTTVTLTATPTAGSYISPWTGPVSDSASYAPRVVVNGATTVGVAFTPANRSFVTNGTFTGNLGNMAGANAKCGTEATAAGLAGNFIAWVSTSSTNANNVGRINNARGWVRVDGLPFADTVADLSGYAGSGHIFYPNRLNAAGTAVALGTFVLTGTQGGVVSATFNCGDLTQAVGNSLFGLAEAGVEGWSFSGSSTCAGPFRIHCLQNDYTAVVKPPVPVGAVKHLFVSKASVDPSSGLNAFDLLCNTEGRDGGYAALVAPSGATPASRFTSPAGTVQLVRPDSVVLAPSYSTFLTAPTALNAPAEVSFDGVSYLNSNGAVWTGSASPTTMGTMATTCNNWSTNSGALVATTGKTNLAGSTSYFNGSTTSGCSTPQVHIYCLEK